MCRCLHSGCCFHDRLSFRVTKLNDPFSGFVGVYIAGHVLEVTKNWNLVFNQTIEVICVGWVIFMIFGTGKRIV